MLKTRQPIDFDDQTVARGYRSCRTAIKKHLKPYLWTVGNIAGEQRQGVDALLAHLLSVMDLLDLESSNGLSLDVWHEVRDDLSDAFLEKYARVELAALVDACRKFSVPKQFVFDPLRGADLWIRSRKFANFDELETFCSYVGGSTMAALVPVVGFLKDDYELTAIACGKAVMLTQLLAGSVTDLKHGRVFLAQDDIKECNVDLSRMKLRQPHEGLRHLVRLYVSRIEKQFFEAGKLVAYLDFDGRRSLSSLLAYYWKSLMQMQRDPESVLHEDGVIHGKELLALKSRHVLGMEQKVAIIPDDHGHGH